MPQSYFYDTEGWRKPSAVTGLFLRYCNLHPGDNQVPGAPREQESLSESSRYLV